MDTAGHRAITLEAVQRLYASGHTDTHGQIDQRAFEAYFHDLNDAQRHADRWTGPTWLPAWVAPGAQREHAMADPGRTAQQNLARDRDFVVSELNAAQAAHRSGDTRQEIAHLGAAVHALEDSYSDAHIWRADSVYSGNPHAPVQAINVFAWFGSSHDGRFDEVPVNSEGHPTLQNHQAAVAAVTEMLGSYYGSRDASPSTAGAAFANTVGQFFQPASGGVHQNQSDNHEWQTEAHRRLDIAYEQQAHASPGIDAGAAPPDASLPAGAGDARSIPPTDTSAQQPSPGPGSGPVGQDPGIPDAGSGPSGADAGSAPTSPDQASTVDAGSGPSSQDAGSTTTPAEPSTLDGGSRSGAGSLDAGSTTRSGEQSAAPGPWSGPGGQDPGPKPTTPEHPATPGPWSGPGGQDPGPTSSGPSPDHSPVPEAASTPSTPTSIDPAHDPSSAMSVAPGPGHEPSGGISVDPTHDPSAAMSIDPPHDHSAAMSIDPAHDANAAMSIDPAHDANAAMSVDPAHDPNAAVSTSHAIDAGFDASSSSHSPAGGFDAAGVEGGVDHPAGGPGGG